MNMTATIDINSSSNKVEDLKRILDTIPGDATYSVRSYAGDRPWDTGGFTITFNWEV